MLDITARVPPKPRLEHDTRDRTSEIALLTTTLLQFEENSGGLTQRLHTTGGRGTCTDPPCRSAAKWDVKYEVFVCRLGWISHSPRRSDDACSGIRKHERKRREGKRWMRSRNQELWQVSQIRLSATGPYSDISHTLWLCLFSLPLLFQ